MPRLPRAYWLTALLAGLAWVSALMLAAEWIALKHQRSATSTASTSPPAPPPPDIGDPRSPFALPEKGKFERMVLAPLFMENRRPGQDAAPEPPPVEKKPPTSMNFKLMGVVKTPRGRVALIEDGKGKYKRLKAQDSLEGWQMTGVDSDGVRFKQGDQSEGLRLLKKRPKQRPPTGAAPAPAPRPEPIPPQRPGQPPPPPNPAQPRPPIEQGNHGERPVEEDMNAIDEGDEDTNNGMDGGEDQ
jgi:hypothetical protein